MDPSLSLGCWERSVCHGIITALPRSEKIGRKTVVVGEGEPVSPLSGPAFVVVGVQHTDMFCVSNVPTGEWKQQKKDWTQSK